MEAAAEVRHPKLLGVYCDAPRSLHPGPSLLRTSPPPPPPSPVAGAGPAGWGRGGAPHPRRWEASLRGFKAWESLLLFFCDPFCSCEGISSQFASKDNNECHRGITRRQACVCRYIPLLIKPFMSVRGSLVIVPILQMRKPRLAKIRQLGHSPHRGSDEARIQIQADGPRSRALTLLNTRCYLQLSLQTK